MMMFVLIIHIIVCFFLIVLVLIQRGRGGGLVESFSGVESMFGTRTSQLLTRATTILSTVFFCTCLILAMLSVRQSKSLMRSGGLKIQPVAAETKAVEPTAKETVPAAVPSAAEQAVPAQPVATETPK